MGRRVGMVVAGLAVGALLVARMARAQEPDAASPAAVLPEPPKPAVTGRSPVPASAPRRMPAVAYAPEAAASSTRLAPEERAARQFLRAAALVHQIESEASRIAIARGHSPGVRAFAVDLLQARQAAEPELIRLLHAREMAPPLMDIAQRKALQRLARVSGPKFDREYLDLVALRQQREDIEQHERALQAITDPVLKGWIERQLPLLRDQQAVADRIATARGTDVANR